MAGSAALRLVQHAKHSSNVDVTATPGSLANIELIRDPTITARQGKYDVNTLRGDNERTARGLSVQETGFDFETFLKGISGNDGTTVAYATETEIGNLLDTLCGAVGNNDGHATVPATSSALTGGTPSVTVGASEAADFTIGNAVLVDVSADASEVIAREIVSIAGDVMTVDRGGWSGSTTSNTVYPSASWHLDNDAFQHTHHYFSWESQQLRRDMFGCLPATATINFPGNGDPVRVGWSFRGSDWTVVARAPLSYTQPTAGSRLVALDAPFWIGSSKYFLMEATLAITLNLVPKTTYSAVNGHHGFMVTDKSAVLTGKLWLGALANEGTSALLDTFHGTTVQDIAFQVGRAAAGAAYFRMPAADFDASVGISEGMDVIEFEARTSRSANHANVPGALRIHLF